MDLVGGSRRAALRAIYEENERRIAIANAEGKKADLIQPSRELLYGDRAFGNTGALSREDVLKKFADAGFIDHSEITGDDCDIDSHDLALADLQETLDAIEKSPE